MIPADAALGDYTHDGMGNSPLAKVTDASSVREVAGRVRGNTAIEVGAMPTTWEPSGQDGWRIVRRELEIGQLVFLER
jgi:hypothetical protein